MALRDHGWRRVAPSLRPPSTSRVLRALIPALVVLCAPALLPLAARAQLPAFDRVLALQPPRPIGDAELVDQDAKTFHLSALRGKVAFVVFGFTNCPDICPLSMERLGELHNAGGVSNKDVAYVMISVDGERDTPEAMKAFVTKYSPDFIGLTAEPSRVEPIAGEFQARFFKGNHDHGGGYSVAHSSQIFVLDTAGRLRAEVYGASLDAMAGLTRALLAEGK